MKDKTKTPEESLARLFGTIRHLEKVRQDERRQQEDQRISSAEKRRPLWWRE